MAEALVVKEGHLVAYGERFPLEGVSKASATLRRKWGTVLTLFLLFAVVFTFYAVFILWEDIRIEQVVGERLLKSHATYNASAPNHSSPEGREYYRPMLERAGVGIGLPQQRFVRRMPLVLLALCIAVVAIFVRRRTPCIALAHRAGRTYLVDVRRSDKGHIPRIVQAINDAIPACPAPAG
jgi:hypothetical protein